MVWCCGKGCTAGVLPNNIEEILNNVEEAGVLPNNIEEMVNNVEDRREDQKPLGIKRTEGKFCRGADYTILRPPRATATRLPRAPCVPAAAGTEDGRA